MDPLPSWVDDLHARISQLAVLIHDAQDLARSPSGWIKTSALIAYNGPSIPGNFNTHSGEIVNTSTFLLKVHGLSQPLTDEYIEGLVSKDNLRGPKRFLHLLQQLSFDTRAFLRLRVSQVPWLFSSGLPLLDVLHTTPLKAIPCHARLAILRWLNDSEPDLHFRLRPFLSRSSPCICGCGLLSSIYPFGLLRGAFHSSHLHFDLLYALAFSSLPDDSLSPQPTVCTLLFLRLLISLYGPFAPVKPPTPLLSSLPPYPIGAHFPVSFVAQETIPFNIGSSSVLSWHLPVASFSNNLGKPGSGFSLRTFHSSVELSLVDYGSPLGSSFMRDLAFPPPHWLLPLLLLPHSLNYRTCSL